MLRPLADIALIAAAPALAAEQQATGSFEVKMTKESETRYTIAKTFTGGMTGSSTGVFLGHERVMAYVAMETFTGSVDGRAGGFVMMHRGYQDGAKANRLEVMVAPGSGTGALAGITGSFEIRIEGGKHFYTLRYELPSR